MRKTTFLILMLVISSLSAQEIFITNASIGLSEVVSGQPSTTFLDPCSQGQDGFDINGAAGSNTINGFLSAVDVIIEAGESFTLESIDNINMLTIAGFLPTTAKVTYFKDDGSFPSSTEIGSESDIPVSIKTSAPWVNPAADVHNVDINVTDITFDGDPGVAIKIWIGIQFENNDPDEGPTFWEIRQDDIGGGSAALVGEPLVQRDPDTGNWGYIDFGNGNGDEINSEGFYTLNGQCDPLLNVGDNILSQVSLYPSPATTELTLRSPASIQIDAVTVFDVLGKQVPVLLNGDKINVSNLQSGVYLIQIDTNKGVLTQKFVKE